MNHQTEPDYDRALDAPEFSLPDDHTLCIICDEIVPDTHLTELQLDLNVCNDACGYQQLQALRKELKTAVSDANRYELALELVA